MDFKKGSDYTRDEVKSLNFKKNGEKILDNVCKGIFP